MYGNGYFILSQDKNDFVPSFEKSVYTAPAIKETVSAGTAIVTVSANDDDPDVSAFLPPLWEFSLF